jgi:hypothetical protein
MAPARWPHERIRGAAGAGLLNMGRALVTGASGYIGGRLVRERSRRRLRLRATRRHSRLQLRPLRDRHRHRADRIPRRPRRPPRIPAPTLAAARRRNPARSGTTAELVSRRHGGGSRIGELPNTALARRTPTGDARTLVACHTTQAIAIATSCTTSSRHPAYPRRTPASRARLQIQGGVSAEPHERPGMDETQACAWPPGRLPLLGGSGSPASG